MITPVRRWFFHSLDALRHYHAASVTVADALLCLFAGATAFLLRFEFEPPERVLRMAGAVLLVWLGFKMATFWLFDLRHFSWRHTSTPELKKLLGANFCASAAAAVALFAFYRGAMPRSLPPIDLMLSIGIMAGARLIVRLEAETESKTSGGQKRQAGVFIYGAGNAGISLLREIQQNPALEYRVSGFVDDDPRRQGAYVHGTRVLGSGSELKELAMQYPVDLVLVAIGTASSAEMSAIYDNCMKAGLVCRILPGLAEVVEGRSLTKQFRNISIEDLLGRNSVVLDQESLIRNIAARTVMVTGAAGSIGSEMCRQIARFQPKAIIGYECAETPLFFLEREMKERFPRVPFYAVIGSIQDRKRLAETFVQYQPVVVYHAAAYKHVPVMEMNPYEAVANNIFGTESVLRTAQANGVRAFVMISTDKAVRPTNVMGTT